MQLCAHERLKRALIDDLLHLAGAHPHRGHLLHQVQMLTQTPGDTWPTLSMIAQALPAILGQVLSAKKCAKSTFIHHTLFLKICMHDHQAFIGKLC